jgi:hypothetical protein
MTYIVACYLGLIGLGLWILRRPHVHRFTHYHTTSDRSQSGVVCIAWWICKKCGQKKATCARMSMNDEGPVTIPRPE